MPIGQHSTAPNMARVQRSSTVDLITAQLRNAIYDGLLLPGSQLHEAIVAQQLGVSRGSLRESAQRLVQDGLLVARPGQGLRVATVGVEDLESLYAARLVIEEAALRTLAGLPGREARRGRLATVIPLLERLEEWDAGKGVPGSPRAIGDTDLELHFETVKAAGNLRLAHFMTSLVMETRIASLGHPRGYIVRTDVGEVHRQRLELVLSGRGDAAVEQLGEHFRDTLDRLTGRVPATVATAAVEQPEKDQQLGPIAT
ncbi:hypothetical protein CIK75_09330 [Glutamicibacter sp. BW78]|nr:hypothetical protein CIK75_09330 [Glutamicibacter sp. BW78]